MEKPDDETLHREIRELKHEIRELKALSGFLMKNASDESKQAVEAAEALDSNFRFLFRLPNMRKGQSRLGPGESIPIPRKIQKAFDALKPRKDEEVRIFGFLISETLDKGLASVWLTYSEISEKTNVPAGSVIEIVKKFQAHKIVGVE